MKVLIEVVIICLLILVGWRQPFQEHAARILPTKAAARWGVAKEQPAKPVRIEARKAAPAPALSQPTPVPSRRDDSWMWQPKPLDPPKR